RAAFALPSASRRISDAVAVGHRLAAGRRDLVADLLGRRGAAAALAVDGAAQVVHHHPGAFPGGQQRHLAADAAAGTGDQHDLVLQHVGHLSLPLSYYGSSFGARGLGRNSRALSTVASANGIRPITSG